MKNLFLTIIISFTFLISFGQISSTVTQTILQEAFSANLLKKIFTEEKLEECTPLMLYTNNHFSEKIELAYQNTSIKLETDPVTKNPISIINVTDFNIKNGTKAFLEFYFDQKRIRIKLKKVDNAWSVYSTAIKGAGIRLIDVEF